VNRRATQNKAPMRGVAMTVPRSPVDIKFIDTAAAGYGCDTTGSVTLLNGVATGTDFTNRIGRRIRNIRVLCRGFMAPESYTSTINNLVRIMIVIDHQPNGAIAGVTDILASSSSMTDINISNCKRFSIIKDMTMALGYFSNTATQAVSASMGTEPVVFEQQLNVLSEFLTTGGTITGLSSNALLLLTIGSVAAGSGHNLNAYFRIYFDG
jgi:hypothetical protein